jgi:NTE family protein
MNRDSGFGPAMEGPLVPFGSSLTVARVWLRRAGDPTARPADTLPEDPVEEDGLSESAARLRREQLEELVARLFGAVDAATLDEIASAFSWRELAGGERLFAQGEPGDSLFLIASGRLKVTAADADGDARVVAEIPRGESVGEMAVLTGEARNASVHAARDTLLAELDRDRFRELAARHPSLALNLAEIVVRRLSGARAGAHVAPVRNVAIVPLGAPALAEETGRRLAAALAPFGSVLELSSDRLAGLGAPAGDAGRLTAWLNEREEESAFVLYHADAADGAWTRRAIRQADRVLLVAEAGGDPAPGAFERALAGEDGEVGHAGTELVLLHADGSQPPAGTAAWLAPRRLLRHHHLRRDRDGDFARLARFLAGRAVGIVFAGGGAKAFGHLGIVRALREAGVPIDAVGGTSLGALVAAGVAADWPQEELESRFRAAFTRRSPLGDWSLPPLVAMARGGRIRRLLDRHFGELDLEDLWLPAFCVSSNLSTADVAVHRRGALGKALLAGLSLPGILPPVVYGDDLHVDGGIFDNLPVGAMRALGAGRVVACDVEMQRRRQLGYRVLPSNRELIVDRYLTRRRRRKVPGLVSVLMTATVLASLREARRAAAQADVHLRLAARGIGLTAWRKLDRAASEGYAEARQRLDEGAFAALAT